MSERLNLKTLYCKLIPIVENKVNALGTLMTGDSLHLKRFSDECVRLTLLRDNSDKVKNIVFYEGAIKQLPVNDSNNDSECDRVVASRQTSDIIPETYEPIHSGNIADITTPEKNIELSDKNPSSSKDNLGRTNPQSLEDGNPSSLKYDLNRTNHQSLEDGNPSSLEDDLVIVDGANHHSLEDGNPSSLEDDLVIVDGANHHSLEDGNPSSLEDDLVIVDGANHHSLEDGNPSSLKYYLNRTNHQSLEDDLVIVDGRKHHSSLDGNPSSSKENLVVIDGTNHNFIKNYDSNHSLKDGYPLTLKDNLVTIDGRGHHSLEGCNPSSSKDDLVIIDETRHHSLEDGYPSSSKDNLVIIDGTNNHFLKNDDSNHSLKGGNPSSSKDDLVIIDETRHHSLEKSYPSSSKDDLVILEESNHNFSENGNTSSAPNKLPQIRFISDDHTYTKSKTKRDNPHDEFASDESDSDEEPLHFMKIANGPNKSSLDRSSSSINYVVNTLINNCIQILALDGLNDSETNDDAGRNLNLGFRPLTVGTSENFNLNVGSDEITSLNSETEFSPSFGIVNKPNFTAEINETDTEKNTPVGVTSISNPDIGVVVNHNQTAKINQTDGIGTELNPSNGTADVIHASKQNLNSLSVKQRNLVGTVAKPRSDVEISAELSLSDGNSLEHRSSDGTAPELCPSVENTVGPNKTIEALLQLNPPDATPNVRKTAKEKINTGTAEKRNQNVGISAKFNPDVKSIAEYKPSDGSAEATSNLNQIVELNLTPKTSDAMSANGAEKRAAYVRIADHKKIKDETAARCNPGSASNLNAAVSPHIHLGITIPDIQPSCHELGSAAISNLKPEIAGPKSEVATDPNFEPYSTIYLNHHPRIAESRTRNYADVANPILISGTSHELNVSSKNESTELGISKSSSLKPNVDSNSNLGIADKPGLITETYVQVNPNIRTLGMAESSQLYEGVVAEPNLYVEIADKIGVDSERTVQQNLTVGIAENQSHYPRIAETFPPNEDGNENSNTNLGIADKPNFGTEIGIKPCLIDEKTIQLNSSIESGGNTHHNPEIAANSHLNMGVDQKLNLGIDAHPSLERAPAELNFNFEVAEKPNLDSGIDVKPCLFAEETIQLNPTIEIAAHSCLNLESDVKPSLITEKTVQLNSTIETVGNPLHNPGIAENSYLNEGIGLKLNVGIDVHPSHKGTGTDLNLNPEIAADPSLKRASADLNFNLGIADKPNLDPGISDKPSLIARTSLQLNPTNGIAENPNTNPEIDAYSILLSGNAENLNPSVGIAENRNVYSQTVPITNLNTEISYNLKPKSKSTSSLVIIETPVHSNPNLESIPLLQLFQNLNSSKNQIVASDFEIKSPFESEKMKRKPSVKTYKSKNKRFKRTPLKVPNCSEIVQSILSKEIDYPVENYCDSQQIDTSNYWTIDPLYRSIGYFDTNNHLEFEDHLNKVMFNSFERVIPSGKESMGSKTKLINSGIKLNLNNIEIVNLSSEPTTSNNINFKFNNSFINDNHFIIINTNDVEGRKIEMENPMQLSDRISNENIAVDNDKNVNINVIDVNACFNVNNDSNYLTSSTYYTNQNSHILSHFKPSSKINIENQIQTNTSSITNEIVPNFKQYSNINIESQIPTNTSSGTNEIVPNFKQYSNINVENQIPTNISSSTNEIFPNFKQFSNINIENQIPTNTSSITNEIVPNFKQFSNINIASQIPTNTSSSTNEIVPNFKQFSNINIISQIPNNTSSGTNEIVPNFKQFSNINIENQIPTNTSSITNEIVLNFKQFSNKNIENKIPNNTSSGTNEIVPNFKTFSNIKNDSGMSNTTNPDPKMKASNEMLSNFKSSTPMITSLVDLPGTEKSIKSIIKCKRNLIKKKVRFNLPEGNSECSVDSTYEKSEFSVDSTNEKSKSSIESVIEEKPTKEIHSNKPKNISSLGNKSYSRNVYGSKRIINLKNINHSFFNSRNVGKLVNCNNKQSVFCNNESVTDNSELISSRNESFSCKNESFNSKPRFFNSDQESIGSGSESINSRSKSIGSRKESFSSRMESLKNKFNRVSPMISNRIAISNVEGSKNNSDKSAVVKDKNNQSGMKLNNEISLSHMNEGLKVPAMKSYQKVNRKLVGNETSVKNRDLKVNKDTKEVLLSTGNKETKEISVLTGNKDTKEISLLNGSKDIKAVSILKGNGEITEISLINEKEGKNETLLIEKNKEMLLLKGNKDITGISLIREDEGKNEVLTMKNDVNELSVSKGNKHNTEISLIKENESKDETLLPKEVVDKKEILLLIKKKKDMNKLPVVKEKEVGEDYLVETMVITEGKEGKDVNGDSSSMVIKNDDCRNEVSVIKEGGDNNETWVMKEYKIINDSLVQEDEDDSKKKSFKKSKSNTEVFSIYNDAENPDLIIIETINEHVPTKVIKRSEKLNLEKPRSATVDLEKPILNCHYCKFKTKYKTSIIRHLASKHFDEMGLKGKKTYTYKKKYKVINENKLKLKIVNVPKKRGRKKLKKNLKIESDSNGKKEITRKRKLVLKNDMKTSTQTVRKQPKMESWQVESIVSGLCQNIINKESVETMRIGSNNVKIGFRSRRRENPVVNSSKKQIEVTHLPKRVFVERTEEELEKYKIRCIRCNDDNVYTENQLRIHLLEKHEKNVSSSVKLICSLCFTAFDDLVGHMKLNHPDTTFNINPCSLFG